MASKYGCTQMAFSDISDAAQQVRTTSQTLDGLQRPWPGTQRVKSFVDSQKQDLRVRVAIAAFLRSIYYGKQRVYPPANTNPPGLARSSRSNRSTALLRSSRGSVRSRRSNRSIALLRSKRFRLTQVPSVPKFQLFQSLNY
jgi:hypothetical protein